MSYHLKEIPKGVLGEFSKLIEEFEECKDSFEQGNKIMLLVELSDFLGAMEHYLKKNYGETITIADLLEMTKATNRAFNSGHRKSKI